MTVACRRSACFVSYRAVDEGARLGRVGLGAIVGLWVLVAAMVPGWARDATVRVQPGQSLRDIAQVQLGDPDLWTEILRANGLASPADVQPGMDLVMPTAEIAAANPQQRIVQPTEIAALAAFLCRDEAQGITMENISVTGGALW